MFCIRFALVLCGVGVGAVGALEDERAVGTHHISKCVADGDIAEHGTHDVAAACPFIYIDEPMCMSR